MRSANSRRINLTQAETESEAATSELCPVFSSGLLASLSRSQRGGEARVASKPGVGRKKDPLDRPQLNLRFI